LLSYSINNGWPNNTSGGNTRRPFRRITVQFVTPSGPETIEVLDVRYESSSGN